MMSAGSPRYVFARQPMRVRMLRSLTGPGGAIYVLLVLLLIALAIYNPSLTEPGAFMRFLGRSAPVLIVALGQYYVIVSGGFDLSMGAVIAAQVVLSANLIGQDPGRIFPVLLLMGCVGAGVGLVNGLVTTLLRVPSFIGTLGTSLVLSGLTFYGTGGAPIGNPADAFRAVGRDGVDGLPVLGFLPYSVIVLAAVVAGGAWLMRRPFGRLLISAGDNERTTALSGMAVWWLQTRAFMLSSLAATVAAILLVGYAGASPFVGQGYEFTAITAVALGGVVLGGGRGWILSAVAAALVLEVLFSLLDFVGIAATWRPAVQGVIIVVALGIPWIRQRFARASHGAGPSVTPADAVPLSPERR